MFGADNRSPSQWSVVSFGSDRSLDRAIAHKEAPDQETQKVVCFSEVPQIANDIGMSRQNVEHYMRFKDQMQVAAQGQKRIRLVSKED